MSAGKARLGDVAPARPLKGSSVIGNRVVWQLNLDRVEAQSGRILEKQRVPAETASSSTHFFDSRHVLYSKLRPYLNKVVLPDELGVATTELVPMLPDPNRLDRKYLVYYLRSKFFVDWVSQQVAGAKMPRVSMKVFWDHEIHLPSLEEQKRIATILDKADALRSKRQQAIELADQFLRSVFLEMFGDPVSNPKGWNEAPLATGIARIESGWSAKGDNRPAGEGQIGVLKISSITSGKFISSENKVVDESTVPAGKQLLKPRAGDLLFSRANTRDLVAATAIVDKDHDNLFLPDKLWKIQTNEQLLPEFLNYLLWHQRMRDRLRSQATGTSGSMLNISKKKFEETSAIFPPIEQQRKFVDMYRKARAISEKYSSASDLTEELFASASQKAFSSQL